MKKLLLFSAVAFSAATMMAQEGTDITPANYKFNTATTIPWYPELTKGANLPVSGMGVWEGNEALAENWNDGLIAIASAGQADANFQNLLKASSIIDLGGEVGRVYCFAGQQSGIKEKLAELYPDGDYSNIPVQTGGVAGFNYNFFSDPSKTPTEKDGYIHFRMVFNVYHNTFDGSQVFQNIYHADNQNNNKTIINSKETNEATTPSAILNNEFVQRYPDDNEPVEDDFGNLIWEPTKWMVLEYDFNIRDVDSDGKHADPFRMKMQTVAANGFANLALFIKEVSFTWMDGNPQIVGERAKSYVTMTPAPKGDVLAGVSSPVVELDREDGRIFNLQGMEVQNPTVPGIYIQNGKKFIVR